MSEPFIGEIRMFAGNFNPRGWAFCDGQLLPVNQNDALFSLLGTIYGGDGRTTFALPDLRGRIPLHFGSGPGLTNRRLGEKGGTERETISSTTMASHKHLIEASSLPADSPTPVGNVVARSQITTGNDRTIYGTAPDANLHSEAFTLAGGGQPHTNVQPFLCINFIIALVGIYPSRS